MKQLLLFVSALVIAALLATFTSTASGSVTAASFPGMTTLDSSPAFQKGFIPVRLIVARSVDIKSTGSFPCLVEVPFKSTPETTLAIHVEDTGATFMAASCLVISTDYSTVRMRCSCQRQQ